MPDPAPTPATSTPPTRVRGALTRVPGISLANKSQVLFGLSAFVILFVALAVPWIRGSVLIREFGREEAVRVAAAWLDGRAEIPESEIAVSPFRPRLTPGRRSVDVTFVPLGELRRRPNPAETSEPAEASGATDPGPDSDPDSEPAAAPASAAGPPDGAAGGPGAAAASRAGRDAVLDFVLDAATWFADEPGADAYERRFTVDGVRLDRVAVPVRPVDLGEIAADPRWSASRPPAAEVAPGSGAAPGGDPGDAEPSSGGRPAPVVAMLIVDRGAGFAVSGRLRNQIMIVSAGVAGFLLSIVAFHLILTKLILSPVRKLRRTAEAVQAGDLAIRSEIRTGDEFEQLAETFNAMLDAIESGRAELERMNRTLDLKVDQLAEVNVDLDESNRLKSEFVASVSHELRTPLNSIIGFAELLQELARAEGEADTKRLRYLGNIVGSSRRLLEMINELLDMAKIEAGRMEVSIEPTSASDLLEGLIRIMGPQAGDKSILVQAQLGDGLPMMETDPGKLQQILYNFLSNAVKFTPSGGSITVGATRLSRQGSPPAVRLFVTDTGPGIPEDMHDVMFEKFRQMDAGHTREHAGTGLGLAICRSLAEMLGATVGCESRPDEGATFFVEVPAEWRPAEPAPLMP